MLCSAWLRGLGWGSAARTALPKQPIEIPAEKLYKGEGVHDLHVFLKEFNRPLDSSRADSTLYGKSLRKSPAKICIDFAARVPPPPLNAN